MSSEFIERLREIEKAATPGPWRPALLWHDGVYPIGPYARSEQQAKADAALIAEARSALPILISRIEKLEAALRLVLDGDEVSESRGLYEIGVSVGAAQPFGKEEEALIARADGIHDAARSVLEEGV